jgi:hypothetical protein
MQNINPISHIEKSQLGLIKLGKVILDDFVRLGQVKSGQVSLG